MTDSPWTTEREGQLFPPGLPLLDQVERSIVATRGLLKNRVWMNGVPGPVNDHSPTVLVLRRDVEVLLAAAEEWAKGRRE